MNEIIAFLILWGIISLLSQLLKKSKQQETKQSQTTRPTKPKTEQEIPPFLKDLLGLPKEEEDVPSATFQVPEQKMLLEPEENLPETEISLPAMKISAEITEDEEEISAPETKIKEEQSEIEVKPLEPPEISYQHQVQYLPGMGKLKRAVIWKEILDKPVSLRGKDLFRNPFIKF
jgi:hypothetical protein